MKKDAKGVLKIKNIILVLAAIITFATSTQIANIAKKSTIEEISKEPIQEKEQVAQLAENINVNEQKLEKKQISKEVYTRDFEITSRSSIKRTENIEQEQEEKTKYISIEEISISKDMDLSIRCGISKEDFKTLMGNLKADTTKFFYDNSDIIYDLCEKYEINEIFFCGLIAGESGWKIASNHRNTCNYVSMMSEGRLIRYSTPEEGLEAAAKLLHNCYLTEGGAYYNGKTIYGVQKCYCPESTWVGLIYGCMKQIV